MRYGVFTTGHKPVVDLASLVWLKTAGTLEGARAGAGPCHEHAAPGSSDTIVKLYNDAQEPWVKRRQQAEAPVAARA